eukprot:gb/GECG01004238.1/.p1 GENE.gb/GECG01004238.1/~~gb/GECG01004238.1/.p1  ORF type:complete len:231 (+),score=26.18 gb/GECG01004238.1/:1-693(+)
MAIMEVDNDDEYRRQIRSRILYTFGTTVVTICAIVLPFMIIPWLPRSRFGALPYMNTSSRRIQVMLKDLAIRKKLEQRNKAIFTDLGSGDGVAVLAAAKQGMIADGYELNPWLVLYSRVKAIIHGVGPFYLRPSFGWRKIQAIYGAIPPSESVQERGRARFYLRNLWNVDLSPYDVIMIFGVQSFMDRLSTKLKSEAKPGTHIILHKFTLPESEGWTPYKEDDEMRFYER